MSAKTEEISFFWRGFDFEGSLVFAEEEEKRDEEEDEQEGVDCEENVKWEKGH